MLTTTLNKVSYSANGATTEFDFGFYIPDQASLKVYLTNVSGVTTETMNYTVSGLDDPLGGTVVIDPALDSGYQVTLARILAYKQEVDLTNQDGFYPEVIESALDRAVMMIQQVAEGLARSIQVPIGDAAGIELPSAVARAGKLLGFDENGNPVPTDDAGNAQEAADAAMTYRDQAAASAAAAAAAAGFDPNDYLRVANNLTDLANVVLARQALGLALVASSGDYADLMGLPSFGNAAGKNVGTAAGTVAAGDDPRFDTSALAPKDSPGFIGNPTAPTQAPSNNSTRLATTEFVKTALAAGAAPTTYLAVGAPLLASYAAGLTSSLAPGTIVSSDKLSPASFSINSGTGEIEISKSAALAAGQTYRSMNGVMPIYAGGLDDGNRVGIFVRVT